MALLADFSSIRCAIFHAVKFERDLNPTPIGTGTALALTDPSEIEAGVLEMHNIDILSTFGHIDIDRLSYAELQRKVGKRKELIQSFVNDLSFQDEDLFEDEFLLQ